MKKSAPSAFTLKRMRISHKLRKNISALSPARVAQFSLAALLIAGFLWIIVTHGPLAPNSVTTEKIRISKLTPEVFGIGISEARHSYTIAPLITGRISRLLVDQGSLVKAGQPVAEIDPVDLDEKLAGSRLMAERAANIIKVAEAQLMDAQSRYKTASATFTRFSDLQSRGFISQEMLDARLHDKIAATAAVDAAAASLSMAKRDQEKSSTDAKGMLKLHNQTHLISPVNGIVIARLAENGSLLVPGQAVLQIVDPADLWIRTRIDQKQAGSLRTGQKARIMLRSHPQTPITGTVERIDLISDSITEERIVNIAFSAPQITLGEQAEVTITLPVIEQARSISGAAIKRVNQQTGVWLLKNGRARFQAVQTGVTTLDGRTQILDGLTDQDEVIVYSQQALQDGLRLKVVPELARN